MEDLYSGNLYTNEEIYDAIDIQDKTHVSHIYKFEYNNNKPSIYIVFGAYDTDNKQFNLYMINNKSISTHDLKFTKIGTCKITHDNSSLQNVNIDDLQNPEDIDHLINSNLLTFIPNNLFIEFLQEGNNIRPLTTDQFNHIFNHDDNDLENLQNNNIEKILEIKSCDSNDDLFILDVSAQYRNDVNGVLVNSNAVLSNTGSDIILIRGDGDCFFNCVVYAFYKEVSLYTTSLKLRNCIAAQIINLSDNNSTFINAIKADINSYNEKSGSNIDVDNMDSVTNFIRSKQYWADHTSIQIISQILNVGFIIYEYNNSTNSTNNSINDYHSIDDYTFHAYIYSPLDDNNNNKPFFYIILAYSNNNHYDLIQKKGNCLFLYAQLEEEDKNNIKNRNSFIGGKDNSNENMENNNNNENMELTNLDKIPISLLNNLYDDNIIFIIDKNADNNPPGKNIGEKIPDSKINSFKDLQKYHNWRRKLDNSWSNTYENKYTLDKRLFTLDDLNWFSVEHYYQASKYKIGHPEFYKLFSLNSKTELSENVKMAKNIGNGKEYNNIHRPNNINVDSYFIDNKSSILEKAIFAKFSQNSELGFILLLTKNAKLMYHRKNKNKLADELMIIRDKIDKLTSVS